MSTTATGARPHWLGTVLYVPLLYGAGWLLARPLALLAPDWRADQLDLAGAGIALGLLLLSLPRRLRLTWGETRPWRRLGLTAGSAAASARCWLQGLLLAATLLSGIGGLLLLLGVAHWRGPLAPAALANALALVVGVGFAEELLFRGWLWGELQLLLPAGQARGAQALLFGLVHPWYRSGVTSGLALLGGLTLLGLALAQLRQRQGGNLWGAIGLHGGLVGGWFLLQHGLLQLQMEAPPWLVGPGQGDVNPLGGALGWLGLVGLLGLLSWSGRARRLPQSGDGLPD